MISQIVVLLSIAQKLCSAFKGRSRCGIETYSWHVIKNNLVSPEKFIYAIFKRSDAVKSSCAPLSSLRSTKCIRCSAETFAMANFVCFCIHRCLCKWPGRRSYGIHCWQLYVKMEKHRFQIPFLLMPHSMLVAGDLIGVWSCSFLLSLNWIQIKALIPPVQSCICSLSDFDWCLKFNYIWKCKTLFFWWCVVEINYRFFVVFNF